MKLEQIQAGMLIAHKTTWATEYELVYIKKVTPKNFRLLQFVPAVYKDHHNFLFKRLWPKDLIGEKIRLASDKEKTILFNSLFSGEAKIA